MEYDRDDTRHPRSSAIANSLAYAAALAWLYADNFEAWRPSMGWTEAQLLPNIAKDANGLESH